MPTGKGGPELQTDTSDALRRIELFSKLDPQELAQLGRLARREHLAGGTVVFFEGDQSDSLYLLLHGSAKVYQTNDSGQEKILRVIRPGDIVGEFAILEELPRSASVETLEPTEVLLLDRRTFRDFVLSHPEVLWKVTSSLCARVRELGEETMELSYRDVPYRLLRRLLLLAERHGDPGPEGLQISANVTLADLAAMVGANRDSVRRYLHRFADEGLIRIGERTLVIPDLTRLRRALEYVSDWF